MSKRRKFPRIFFGWWTVLTSGILSIWVAGFVSHGFAPLFKPISSELGFSRAVTSVAASIKGVEGGLEGPLIGWVVDKFGPRWIVLSGLFLVGLGLILMNFINSLWAFYLVWGVILGTAHNLSTLLPLRVAITNWFVKKRGKALGIQSMLAGLSGVLIVPLVAWLIITRGWRMTCIVGGVIIWVVGLPLAWFFVRQHRPEYYGLLPDGATVEEETADKSKMIDRGVKYAAEVQEVEFTLRQAMRTPAYWLLMLGRVSENLTMAAISLHGIAFLTDFGIEPLRAAGIYAMMYFFGIPTRFIGGALVDRLRKGHLRFLAGGAYLLQAVGFSVFLLNQTIAMIYVWFIIYGIGWGVTHTIMNPMMGRYFGRKAFGSITGSTTMIMMPIGIAAPVYIGWVYDTTGSYITAFTFVAAVLVFSAVLMSFILPPRPPAEVTDIRRIV